MERRFSALKKHSIICFFESACSTEIKRNFCQLKIGNISWEQVLQSVSTSLSHSNLSQFDNSNGLSATSNLSRHVDLRRQSTRHLNGMIKSNPHQTERITDALILGWFCLSMNLIVFNALIIM